MGIHRPAQTTAPAPTARRTTPSRRLLLAVALIALAMALVVAGAGSALAATGRAAPGAHAASSTAGGKAVAERPRSGGGVSPAVPLVFAGIVILAASGPWLPPRSRYVYYRVERRW
jgi:hypothetical protein